MHILPIYRIGAYFNFNRLAIEILSVCASLFKITCCTGTEGMCVCVGGDQGGGGVKFLTVVPLKLIMCLVQKVGGGGGGC